MFTPRIFCLGALPFFIVFSPLQAKANTASFYEAAQFAPRAELSRVAALRMFQRPDMAAETALLASLAPAHKQAIATALVYAATPQARAQSEHGAVLKLPEGTQLVLDTGTMLRPPGAFPMASLPKQLPRVMPAVMERRAFQPVKITQAGPLPWRAQPRVATVIFTQQTIARMDRAYGLPNHLPFARKGARGTVFGVPYAQELAWNGQVFGATRNTQRQKMRAFFGTTR
jgi:hypothetical protein